jgi:hypothetical protein
VAISTFAAMFLKGKYTALVLFSALAFRILFLNVPYIASAITAPVKSFMSLDMKRSSKRKRPEYAQYHASADISTVEVSEESTENDDDETFEKGTKYPALLLTLAPDFRKIMDTMGPRSLAEFFRPKQSSRTYLSISVLRI